ncbi:hypothetical protein DBR43_03750 [Pedobacter sp. KBW06]|uniref:hypothetical protein n=1 Tax=Pedobacter sp. KBW06 TaxID=2153359 RepID=UPI000F5B4CA2|nr:hypothetical protein [Pedobacter sp. KBW06]RQO74515.1 hypothetical protein DBR43_03750 [Pedobacter sp. KBW06]
MIGDFIQLNAFTIAVVKLGKICCRGEEYFNEEATVRIIWDEFLVDLDKRIEEQDTYDKLSIFIKVAQTNLTVFADKLYNLYSNLEPCKESCHLKIKGFLYQIATEVVETIETLNTKYSDLFYLNGDIPYWIIYNNKKAIAYQNRIKHNLELRQVDPELTHILDSHLSGLHIPGNSKIKSWRQFFYLQNLTWGLLAYVESPTSDTDTLKLLKILIGWNFNPLVFYEFMLEYSVQLINADMPYEEQEMELLVFLRTIENIRPERKDGYNIDVPPIQESICSYLQRELATVARMKDVLMPYTVNGLNGRTSNYYFEVATTIEELFFLVRIMLEVRFIKTKFKANLYSFVARHIRTDRSKSPSTQYMRNVFAPNKEVPSRIIRKIRGWLMTMISYIDTHFGSQLKIWAVGAGTYSLLSELNF